MMGDRGGGPGGPGGGGDGGGGGGGQHFFKTRLCNEWQANKCNYGDKCRYAHGEDQLRGGHWDGRKGPPRNPHGGGHGGGRGGGPRRGPEEMDVGMCGDLVDPVYFRKCVKKQRICQDYVKRGSCQFGNNCGFSHDVEEQNINRSETERLTMMIDMMGNQAGMMPPLMAGPGGMGMGFNMGPMAPHMGPMMSGPGMGGMPPVMMGMMPPGPPPLDGPTSTSGRPPGPLPPDPMKHIPGPAPPKAPHPSAKKQKTQDPLSPHQPSQGPAQPSREEVTYIDRVRAVCSILQIGNSAKEGRTKPGAQQAALTAIRSGTAFRANAFADDVTPYLPTPT